MKHMWSEEEINKAPKVLDSLVDSKGNPRFIEGDGEPLEQEGVNITYCKWSLSGTHLMIVVAGNLTNTTVIANNSILAKYQLPNFILDKIYPVWEEYLSYDSRPAYSSGGTNQMINYFIEKTSTSLNVKKSGALTLTDDRGFRIQFDLLIDSE